MWNLSYIPVFLTIFSGSFSWQVNSAEAHILAAQFENQAMHHSAHKTYE